MEKKDAKAQTHRITMIALEEMAERYPGVSHSVGYDIEKDRTIVKVGGETLEFGPKEWFMGDRELTDLIVVRLTNALGPGARKAPKIPPF